MSQNKLRKNQRLISGILIFALTVSVAFAAGFLVGERTFQEDRDDTENDVDPVLGRFLYAGVVTERMNNAVGMDLDNIVAMNSTNDRLRNRSMIQEALDRAVEINGTDEDEPGVSHDVRKSLSEEEYENVSRVLGGVPFYDLKGLQGHAVRHRGETVFIGTVVPRNDTARE